MTQIIIIILSNTQKCIFFDNYDIYDNKKNLFKKEYKKYCKRIAVKRRILRNRIVRNFYKKPVKPINEFQFQCYLIAKIEKVDIVINEGNWDSKDCLPFYKLVGKKNVYYHIHYTRDEDVQFRNELPNSIAISKYVSDTWVADKSIVGKNFILYNGIDIEKFQNPFSPEQMDKKRNELGINENDFIVIFCGRLVPVKGIEQLLNAFDKLAHSNIKLLLIGNVDFSTNTKTDFSQRMISKANNMNNVIYLGYIPNEEMPLYYQISHLQVIPSIWQEGAGLVCIEGMASGLPLVITKSGGMIEYADKSCSIQIPIDNELSDNLAKEIEILSKNTKKREAMSEAGKNRAKQFSFENYYNNFIRLFE